ncbi:MAG: SMP-30/gluconolactonase/LRE family protein [Bryobacteraceae bacterium]|nr:SMP-30/gluconolactonase/LRE family protein [Bryobacteraceae bacterium]MDW8379932.1 SMP-30/gluconolactonase/LRE family protein [Bryobacterales bacterium]
MRSSLLLLVASLVLHSEPLWRAKPFTEPDSFTAEIEGPAVDRQGYLYAVSFLRKPTIGRISPEGRGEIFLEFTNGSLANGIRFDAQGRMFVADYTNHNVLLVDTKTRSFRVFVHEPRMNQPNDLAIAPDGTLYASDPDWQRSTGQLWRIDPRRRVKKIADGMGTTNGIEVSPDGRKLYVNESVQRKVWVFDIQAGGDIANKRLLVEFPDFGFDGMRCDVLGNLYITRHGKGTVVVVSPQGQILREIDVLGRYPTNLCFGGPDGKTVYVTEAEQKRVVTFRTDTAGLEWARWPGNRPQ